MFVIAPARLASSGWEFAQFQLVYTSNPSSSCLSSFSCTVPLQHCFETIWSSSRWPANYDLSSSSMALHAEPAIQHISGTGTPPELKPSQSFFGSWRPPHWQNQFVLCQISQAISQRSTSITRLSDTSCDVFVLRSIIRNQFRGSACLRFVTRSHTSKI